MPFGLVRSVVWPGLLAEFTRLKFSLNFTRVNGSLRRKQNMLILRVGRLSICGGNDAQLLRKHGISSEHTESGRDSLEFLRLYDYDLVLMDLDLPDMPGHEAIRLARAAGLSTPSIILAEAAAPQVKVKALDQGADDFVTTPCHPEELLARVRAVVRRSQGHANSVLRLGPVELSLDRHEVRVNGQKLSVSRREFSVWNCCS